MRIPKPSPLRHSTLNVIALGMRDPPRHARGCLVVLSFRDAFLGWAGVEMAWPEVFSLRALGGSALALKVQGCPTAKFGGAVGSLPAHLDNP